MPFYIKKMNHASLFSGIGAAEIAAREMGWRNLFHCEINGFCRRIQWRSLSATSTTLSR